MKRSKKPAIEGDNSNLPCDIIEAILSRLPVRSLFRFKSVSKSWYSIISDSNFARIHLNQSKNSDETLFILGPCITYLRFCLFGFKDQASQIEAELDFPIKKYRRAFVMCACDGLVLLKNHDQSDKMYVLWNPSSRKYARFSSPYEVTTNYCLRGLCYDPSNDDYKFILSDVGFYTVFSFKNNCWRKKSRTMMMHTATGDPGLAVNGYLHWVCNKLRTSHNDRSRDEILLQENADIHYANNPVYERDSRFTYEIIWFDSRDEKFGYLSKPECLEESDVFYLTSLSGNFCLYRNCCGRKIVEIWMMKEYGNGDSWMKFMTIENVPAGLSWADRVKPLYYTSKGEVVLGIDTGFVIYNPREQRKFGEVRPYERRNMAIGRSLFPLNVLDSLFFPIRDRRLL